MEKQKHKGLAVVSIILGVLSMLCCFLYGFAIVPGLIAAIFGIICVIKGEGKVRIMGAVGLVLGVVGIAMAITVLIYYASLINWDNVTITNLEQFKNIDPNDTQAVRDWLQQFVNQELPQF